MAASCVPQISFDPNRSCKCPGQAVASEEYVYYVAFCVTNLCVAGDGSGGTFTVLSAVKDNGSKFDNEPNNCFPATISSALSTPVNSCTTDVYRFRSENSGNFILVTFSVTSGGVTQEYTQQLPSPPFCDNKTDVPDGRCAECTK